MWVKTVTKKTQRQWIFYLLPVYHLTRTSIQSRPLPAFTCLSSCAHDVPVHQCQRTNRKKHVFLYLFSFQPIKFIQLRIQIVAKKTISLISLNKITHILIYTPMLLIRLEANWTLKCNIDV